MTLSVGNHNFENLERTPRENSIEFNCTANQLTGFYMMATVAFTGLTIFEKAPF